MLFSKMRERIINWLKSLLTQLKNHSTLFLVILVWSILLIASLSFTVVLYTTTENTDQIHVESYRSFLYFTLVVIIGGAIASLFRVFERQRDASVRKREMERDKYFKYFDFRKSAIDKLSGVYREVKSARRALRAGLTWDDTHGDHIEISENQAQLYRQQMSNINDPQLVLESLKTELKILFYIDQTNVSDCLRMMEDYLRHILREYENIWQRIEDKKVVKKKNLEHLLTFASSSRTEVNNMSFHNNFSVPYRVILSELIKQTLLKDSFSPKGQS